MYRFADDLEDTVRKALISGATLEEIVVVEEAVAYPGELVFQVFHSQQGFYSRYHEWMSCYLVLNELFNLPAFVDVLEADGFWVLFGPSCEQILKNLERWMEPLVIEGYELYKFQQFGLRRAFESEDWFWNWATGAGKSFVCAAAAKELFAQGAIDQVIACTVSDSKIDLCEFFTNAGLDAVVNDGGKPKRRRGYHERHQVYVMNYEKLWVDYAEIEELVAGAATVFIFDEAHKIVTDSLTDVWGRDNRNNARKAFEDLVHLAAVGSKVWPMSASVVDGKPLRFRDVFGVGHGNDNPLGTQAEFERRYADDISTVELKTKRGKTFPLKVYDWNLARLQDVRHRVGDRTQTARKTDPGLRELFKGMATIVEHVQMSVDERNLADAITDRAWAAYQRGENLGPYYHLLRVSANVPWALRHSESEVAEEMVKADNAIGKITSTKLAKLNDKLEQIREQGDKVLVFTHWTSLTLHLIKDKIKVPHVVHWGTGQSEKESQRVKEEFKTDPDITCYLTSDAGTYGGNFQVARYVIQYDPTYSYDQGMQRASRIDRADSHLDGLTNYVYVTVDSVEERVWRVNNARRLISAAVQGTAELQSYQAMTGRAWTPQEAELARRSENESLPWLIFGDRI
jgi:superfamily II DNA or RNA helicase